MNMFLSIVVPCHNESQSLARLVEVLRTTLPTVADEWEVILVDDGSRDDTLRQMREFSRELPWVRYLALSRNFGKEAAMFAGLEHARGEAVAILDADLQHPPELLRDMVPHLAEGCDQVVAQRTRDGDGRLRSALSHLYYRTANRLVDVPLHDGVGDFRVLSRKAVDALLRLHERNRFAKGLFAWIGFSTVTVPYRNVPRVAGASRWRFGSLVDYGLDGIISFSNRPLRISMWTGFVAVFLSIAYACWIAITTLVSGISVPGYVTTIWAVVGLSGLQMIFLGIIGEYIGRMYLESKHRPIYLLKETSDAEDLPASGS